MNKKHAALCLALLFLMLPLMNFARAAPSNQLALVIVPDTLGQYLPADEKNYTGLMVQSLNGTGYPSKMNETTSLSVFSSYIDILSETSSVSMPVNTSISNNTSVLGIRLYSINVFSNINALINISPSAPNNVYRENTTVTLTAPSSVPFDGFLGALGAKYDFKDWSCSCGSSYTTNPLTVTIMSGDMQNLIFNANYVPEYTIVYVIAFTSVIVVIVISLLLFLSQQRRSEAAEKEKAAEDVKVENKKEPKAETAKIMDALECINSTIYQCTIYQCAITMGGVILLVTLRRNFPTLLTKLGHHHFLDYILYV